MARDQRDYYYRKASEEGYRSRASYKLKQIQEKEHIIRRGDSVVDLGAAPGGWLQVARELSHGIILGVDLKPIEPIEGVTTIVGDITSDAAIQQILKFVGDKGVDVVLCDAAPNLSGNWNVDHARGIGLNEAAFDCAQKILKPGGHFVVKVFQGDMFKEFYEKVNGKFVHVKAYSPPASRSTSAETYIIAKKYIAVSVQKGGVYDVEIKNSGRSGDGMAYIESLVVFVPGTKVGDIVTIMIDDVKPKFAFGRVIDAKDAEKSRMLQVPKENLNKGKTTYVIEPSEEFDEYGRI